MSSHLKRRVENLEGILRRQYCSHEEVMILEAPMWTRLHKIIPPWEVMNLPEPPPSKPIGKKCLLCGEWLPVPNPFEQTSPASE